MTRPRGFSASARAAWKRSSRRGKQLIGGLCLAMGLGACNPAATNGSKDMAMPLPDQMGGDASIPDQGMPDGLPADMDMAMPHDMARDMARPHDMAPDQGDDAGPPLPPPVVHQIPGVMVSTLAGSSSKGSTDGTGAAASFDNPTGLALDDSGLLYVTEYDGNRVRTVDGSGVTHTIPVTPSGADQFACPFGIVVVSPTELLVQTDCDRSGNKTDTTGTLWKVSLPGGAATVLVEGLGKPRGLARLDSTTVAVSDRLGQTVSRLTLPSNLTLLAGAAGMMGDVDGTGAAARFNQPYGIARLSDGSMVLADFGNNALRQITASGTVTTLAGGIGMVDGALKDARFDQPKTVAVDSAGDIFVSDTANHRIRRVSAGGQVESVAGNGMPGFVEGAGEHAEFYGQEGIAVTPDGKTLYVSDGNNGDGSPYHRVRKITIP